MGGITRIIRSLPLVREVIPETPIAKLVDKKKETPVEPMKKEPQTTIGTTKKATFGGTSQQTILTSAQGVEEEANVSKTVLGGSVSKKKSTINNFGY